MGALETIDGRCKRAQATPRRNPSPQNMKYRRLVSQPSRSSCGGHHARGWGGVGECPHEYHHRMQCRVRFLTCHKCSSPQSNLVKTNYTSQLLQPHSQPKATPSNSHTFPQPHTSGTISLHDSIHKRNQLHPKNHIFKKVEH